VVKGFVVSFEGIDGSGKSTVLNEIAKRLAKENVKFTTVRDDGNLPYLHDCRDALEMSSIDISSSDAKFLLYIAQTACAEKRYREWVDRGLVVLVDRGIDTVVAYGALLTGERNEAFYRGVNRLVMTYFDKPDMTFLFSCSGEVRRERLIERKGEEIPENWDEMERKLEAEYRSLVLQGPSRFKSIDTTGFALEATVQEVWTYLEKELRRRKLCV